MADDPIRFLIVDDIPENLMALEALLRRDGLEVHRAGSAAEALELMLVNDYALALLDVQMPEIDGYELAELMRGAERTRRLPIIFVTAAEMDETRRFRGYEAGAVDFIFKPIDPVILKSKAEVFFRIGQQAAALARQRDEMAALARHRDVAIARLKAHADNSPLACVDIDCGLVIRNWSQGAERIFGQTAATMLGRNLAEAGWLDAATVALLTGWITADLPAGAAPRHSAEFTAKAADGRAVACQVHGSVLVEGDGVHRSLSLQVQDVTERQKAEEVRALLIGELNHRIKNTLANVQAIARQTLRQSKTLPDFDRSFGGRLQALSRAHSLLSDSTWSAAPLDALIEDQIRAGTLDATRLDRKGPPVEVSPENMLRLALTLHELATNAQKYGALSTPGGRIALSWRLLKGTGLELTWAESGGPVVEPPNRRGFGTSLIRATAGGDEEAVTVDWRPEGVVWTIRLEAGVKALARPAQPMIDLAEPLHAGLLTGRRILVVEDEPLVAMDLVMELDEVGAEVICVARTLNEALAAATASEVDLAILDGNLDGDPVDAVASTLAERGVPFCFVSGYGPEHLPADFRQMPLVQKPFNGALLRQVLGRLLQH
jgi:PAS domain S-box-containing protein